MPLMLSTMVTAVALLMAPAAEAEEQVSALAKIRDESKKIDALLKSDLTRKFLKATITLPSIEERTLYHTADRDRYYSEAEAEPLDPAERSALGSLTVDENFYYNTKYGSPLAYARALDLIAREGVKSLNGKKVLDFGYGTIGHLKLMSANGASVVGVDVDPILRALYAYPGDQGEFKGGSVTLVHGHFPAEEEVKKAIGDGYDLILSKNVLKNGYIHPAEPVDEKRMVKLGVEDDVFVRTLFEILKPGGHVIGYNLHPAQNPPDKAYIPWADGRSPFTKEEWEGAGFEVIAFDQDDSRVARALGRALGWDQGSSGMDLEKDLFGTYTLVRKPASR